MEAHDIEIRSAVRSDLEQLLDLYRQLNPGDPPLASPDAVEIWERFLLYPGSDVLVGAKEDVIVTSCTLVVVPNLTRGGLPYGLIENVVTASQHRKRGFGGAVLTAAIEAAWRQDCYKVMLLTGSNEPGTLEFYRGVGLEQTKTGFQIRRDPSRKSEDGK